VNIRNFVIRSIGTLFLVALCGAAADATVSVNKYFTQGINNVTQINLGDATVVNVNIQNSDTTTPVTPCRSIPRSDRRRTPAAARCRS
jgi:hypothetical protein